MLKILGTHWKYTFFAMFLITACLGFGTIVEELCQRYMLWLRGHANVGKAPMAIGTMSMAIGLVWAGVKHCYDTLHKR